MVARAIEQIERDWSAEGAVSGLARRARAATNAQTARTNQDGGTSADSVPHGGPWRNKCSRGGGRARTADRGVRGLARDRVRRSRSEEVPRETFGVATNFQGRDQLP